MIPALRSVLVAIAIVGAAGLLAAPSMGATAQAVSGPTIGASFSSIPGSARPTGDVDLGEFTSLQMSVEVVLAPRNALQMSGLATALYDPTSSRYHAWLGKGQFTSLFAPSSAQVAAVVAYLRASGLIVGRSSSPFMVRASGASATVAEAFKTHLRTYRNPRGIIYYSNASAVQVPTSFAASVLGVVGLSDTVRPRSHIKHPISRNTVTASRSCEAPYPTRAQLYAAVNHNKQFPFGYGGGPGCSGLTPSQVHAIYGAPDAGPRGRGSGINLAVFELSAYQRSDIATWVHTFYGSAYKAPLVDIIVDGGPLSPICPPGDTCPPQYNGYSGDDEVTADIEMQLTISPDASHILVYNAPNDYTGQTELDEYGQIATDDLADVVSSSWGECENDAGAAYVQAENLIFEQMALQGQSMFGAAGDNGAFDCIGTDGTTLLNVDDPPSQPWVTSVGGTSLEAFNPGTNPKPTRPQGVETVWNVDNLCNSSHSEGGVSDPGFFWCAETGAGGGGNSQYWGRPFYQYGPGITNPYTAHGNGTTQCSLAAVGAPCREVPDVSLDADEYTPYADYCTGSKATPYSTCATFPGWSGAGGTSLSTPFWSAIIADRDSYQLSRSGNVNQLVYELYNLNHYGYFFDPTGIGQSTNNNGFFPTTPGYDMAVGIGVPRMSPLITGVPAK